MSVGKRLLILCGFYCHGLWLWTLVLAVAITAVVGVSAAAIDWDGTWPVVLRVPMDGYGYEGVRDESLTRILTEGFDILYLLVLLVVVYAVLLLPLAQSFSLSHTLWLRLLPCHPLEVALGRVCRLLAVTLILGLVGAWWAFACAGYFNIKLQPLLLAVYGMIAHVLCSGGIVLVFGRFAGTHVGRATLAVTALVVPVFLFLGYLISGAKLPVEMRGAYPYACPFSHHYPSAASHFTVAACLGLALALISIVLSWGRVVRAPVLASKESNS